MGARGWLMFKTVQDLGLMFRMKDRLPDDTLPGASLAY